MLTAIRLAGKAHSINCHLHCGHGVCDVIINWDKDTNGRIGTELLAHSGLIAVRLLQ